MGKKNHTTPRDGEEKTGRTAIVTKEFRPSSEVSGETAARLGHEINSAFSDLFSHIAPSPASGSHVKAERKNHTFSSHLYSMPPSLTSPLVGAIILIGGNGLSNPPAKFFGDR